MARLPEVLALWYTIRHQEHALGYLEAVIRYVMSAGQEISAEGEQPGLRRGLPDGIELELRFGLDGLHLLSEITKIEDVGVLKALHEGIRSVERPEDLRQFHQGMD